MSTKKGIKLKPGPKAPALKMREYRERQRNEQERVNTIVEQAQRLQTAWLYAQSCRAVPVVIQLLDSEADALRKISAHLEGKVESALQRKVKAR